MDEANRLELERCVRDAAAALAHIDRRLAETDVGSLAGVVAARQTLHAVVRAVDSHALRDVCVAVEHLSAEMRALAAGLALVRRLGPGPTVGASGTDEEG